ncbi:hypothetical protein [Enterocloster bolteae]|uniref:hypothetical protein n=1 Tax=Enterocloster bolteae TaxID=208479 RepID=UPI000E43FF06|nr:hypothetical protein [Enterocloster bolteae]RGK71676.1 hypothetical protein DXC96_17475 [Enterocloster bolteae]
MTEEENKICRKIHLYLVDILGKSIEPDIFVQTSLIQLGKYYFDKLLDGDNAKDTLVKAVIRTIAPKNLKFESMDDYYIGCCKILRIKKLPKEQLKAVKEQYDELIGTRYANLVSRIDSEIQQINQNLQTIHNRMKELQRKKSTYSLMRDLSTDETNVLTCAKKCNSFRTRKAIIQFEKQHLQKSLSEFCNCQSSDEIDSKLRKKALYLSTDTIFNAEMEFSSYRSIIEIIEDDLDRPYALFFKIKIYVIGEKARKNLYMTSYTKTDEERISEYQEYISKVPAIDTLNSQKEVDREVYLETLKNFISDYALFEEVKTMIEESVCLRNRRDILNKCLDLYENSDFEMFNHVVPIQIEGMFADYLMDSTTFRRFTKLEMYTSAVLQEKIQYLLDIGDEIYTEVVEYFMYYFNNIIRNKIAHGNYRSIFKDTTDAEIFSIELLLDMCTLIYMTIRKSETEKMHRFVHGYQKHYAERIAGEHPHYGALFNDVIGQKTIHSYDMVERYRPLQVAYWIINPYYEHIYEAVEDKTDLLELRADFLSKSFWEYALDKLNSVISEGFDYLYINDEFGSVINALFKCNIGNDVKTVLGKVNKAFSEIRKMSEE